MARAVKVMERAGREELKMLGEEEEEMEGEVTVVGENKEVLEQEVLSSSLAVAPLLYLVCLNLNLQFDICYKAPSIYQLNVFHNLVMYFFLD